MATDFIIFVFSYNRGEFLENCIKSIELCASGVPVIIIDDRSTDADTLSVLRRLEMQYKVVLNDNAKDVEHKTGGLSGAMNKAMKIALKQGAEFALFIQDDMQFVRRLSQRDLREYSEYFSSTPNSIQLSTAFIRELSADTFEEDYEISEKAHAYLRKPNCERGKSSFSDTGVFHVRRFHELYHSFEVGEGGNSEKARGLGLVCGRSINPNICWLPYPNSYRGKQRSFQHRFFEYFGRSGFHPIEIMTEDEETRFLGRHPSIAPVMERFLSSPNSPRRDIWSTGGGEYNFVCYGGVFSRIFVGMRSFKKFLNRIIN